MHRNLSALVDASQSKGAGHGPLTDTAQKNLELRESSSDILMLVEYFVQRYAKKAGKSILVDERGGHNAGQFDPCGSTILRRKTKP
jgi:hypothetical protein